MLKLWSDFWKPHSVKTETAAGLVTYALKNDLGALTLFVINKTGAERKTEIHINSTLTYTSNNVYSFIGNSGKDIDVETGFNANSTIDFVNNKASMATFPPYSITVIDCTN